MTLNLALLVPLFPSVSVTSEIASDGGPSSSLTVADPWLSLIEAFVAPLRFTTKASAASSIVSPTTGTTIVWTVVDGVNVNVPERTE